MLRVASLSTMSFPRLILDWKEVDCYYNRNWRSSLVAYWFFLRLLLFSSRCRRNPKVTTKRWPPSTGHCTLLTYSAAFEKLLIYGVLAWSLFFFHVVICNPTGIPTWSFLGYLTTGLKIIAERESRRIQNEFQASFRYMPWDLSLAFQRNSNQPWISWTIKDSRTTHDQWKPHRNPNKGQIIF